MDEKDVGYNPFPEKEKRQKFGGREKGTPNKTPQQKVLEEKARQEKAEQLAKSREIKKQKREEREQNKAIWVENYKSKEDFEQKLNIAIWWDKFKSTNNEKFWPLLFCDTRFLVMKGGAGSGKSIFAGRKILERATTEENHRFLVCRKVARTLRDSCFKQLCSQLSDNYPDIKHTSNKSDMVIEIEKTKSSIIFAGLDDTEKLKSIYGITGIWIEEASEIEEADFDELNRRMRGETPYYKQIILTFNPISITHWLKRRFFDKQDPDVTTHSSTYLDNRFMTDQDKKILEAYKDTDPYQYDVYCLGNWGVTGKTIFNGKAVQEQIDKNIRPSAIGDFEYSYDGLKVTDFRFVEHGNGKIKIYKRPEPGVPYCLGGDTSGDGSDWFVAQVIDNTTGKQVAVLRHQYDEDEYARQVYCLATFYNTALVGVEANFSTHPVKELDRIGYTNQYVREVEDDYRGRLRHSYGFRTDKSTRPNLVAQLVTEARDNIENFVDRETLLEMQTFIRDENLRPCAADGAHDDCVMALGIAHYIRPYQSKERSGQAGPAKRKWTRDMKEDYRNASPRDKEYLIKKWGESIDGY